MNPREQLVDRLIAAGKSDDEIRAALKQFDAQHGVKPTLPSAAPVDQARPQEGQGALSLAKRVASDLTTPKKWMQAATTGLDQATFGLMDEGMAAWKAGNGGTFEQNRQQARQSLNRDNDESGWMGDIAQVGGAVLGPGATGKAIAGRIPAKVIGSSLGRQIAGAGLAGAATGGVTGAASAEPGDRKRGAKVGAVVGGVAGAGVATVSPAARAFARYIGKLPARADELEAIALQKAIKQSGVRGTHAPPRGVNPALDYDANTFEWASRQFKPDAPDDMRVIDLGQETQTLGKDAAKASPRADKALQEMADQRIAEQPAALEGDVNEALGLARREHADEVSRKLMERIGQEDDAALAPIWEQHQSPITEPSVLGAWEDVRTELGRIPATVEAQQVLSRKANGTAVSPGVAARPSGVLDAKGNMLMLPAIPERPNLRAVHEAKIALQKMITAITDAPKNAQSVQSADALQLGALQAAKERLAGIDLARVPGGQEYMARMAASSRDRMVNDQLQAGQKLGSKLSATPWENVRAETQNVVDQTVRGTQIDPTTQRRALAATRKGVASNVRDKARGKGSDALLDELESQNVQEAIVPLQAGRNVNAQDVADRFRERISDRRKMATTNQQQSRIKPQELLEGSKAAGTALGYSEAGGLTGRLGAARTAAGALAGKMFGAQRKEVLALSADQIAQLLQRQASDPTNPAILFERAMLLKMLQQARMREQGRAAGALGSLSTRNDR